MRRCWCCALPPLQEALRKQLVAPLVSRLIAEHKGTHTIRASAAAAQGVRAPPAPRLPCTLPQLLTNPTWSAPHAPAQRHESERPGFCCAGLRYACVYVPAGSRDEGLASLLKSLEHKAVEALGPLLTSSLAPQARGKGPGGGTPRSLAPPRAACCLACPSLDGGGEGKVGALLLCASGACTPAAAKDARQRVMPCAASATSAIAAQRVGPDVAAHRQGPRATRTRASD